MKNQLNKALSPYLLDHADDPVHWCFWSDAAFKQAKSQNKPIFLSIGYSACHWCHVMARESFQDEQVAEILNQFFICIKVDREERPDIDDIYMEALVGLNGHGGWPMSLFLTPEGVPFFAGTYFPKFPQEGQMAFVELLGRVSTLWYKHRQDVDKMVLEIKDHLVSPVTALPQAVNPTQWLESIASEVDYQYGGLLGAPKFPQLPFWSGVLMTGVIEGHSQMIDASYLTASSLLMGGIYDHLDGGMARYSVDEYWHMPHFEKMLSDNAQLIFFLVDLYGYRSHDWFKQRAYHIRSWLEDSMRLESGCFATAIDAEAMGEEGIPYLWSFHDAEQVLGPDFEVAKSYFNWQTSNLPKKRNLVLDAIHTVNQSFDEMAVSRILMSLKLARQQMPQPRLDDKCLLDCNAMLIAGFAKASLVFQDPSWLTLAESTYAACHHLLFEAGTWRHTARGEQIGSQLFLEDLSSLIFATLHLFMASANDTYLKAAKETFELVEDYWSPDQGVYRMNPISDTSLIKNPASMTDDATPSGNALMATNGAILSLLTGENSYRTRAEALLAQGLIQTSPMVMGQWIVAQQWLSKGAVIKGDWLKRESDISIQPNWLLLQINGSSGIEFCDKQGCHADKTVMADLKQIN